MNNEKPSKAVEKAWMQRVAEYVRYEPETGKFYHLERPESDFPTKRIWLMHKRRYAGKECRHVSERGYSRISVGGNLYMAHRLAWLMCHGEWPHGEIDHINHNKLDNRIENLRVTDRSGNMRNSSLSRLNNTGVCGVSWHTRDKIWQAGITEDKKCVYLGRSNDFFEVVCLRKSAEITFGYHQNHGKPNNA